MAARLLPLLVLAVSLAWPASCKPLPVLVPVTKDPATLLYTIPFHYGADLVVDTAGPLVWSTCQRGHLPAEFPCNSPTCRLANAFHIPGCRARGCCHDTRKDRTCTAYPYNPVTGACAPGDLVHTRFVANTTDGVHPVSQVNVRALAACAPSRLLKSLPRGASGVAGLAGSGLALPAQVASAQSVPNKFLLCLPRGGSSGNTGVAIFGGGPFQVSAQPGRDFTQELVYTPLVAAKKGMPPAHYVSLQSIAVESTRVPGAGAAVVCTKVPFTLLRPDVYRPFVDAFARALKAQGAQGGPVARPVKPVPPFELCYDTQSLANTRIGYLVPGVTLTLGGGTNWTMNGLSSMVDLRPGTACLAFARMEGVKAGDRSAPAVLVGGFQMENTVLEFDVARKRLGFVRLPFFTQCGHFNFTKTTGY
ncbi:chitinase CLP-like [Triticum dicoccoides]|uniref:chitinase CLP-like n=1 Tax=Triticum dicoccoides TaxID=85692 RepID=UPI001890B09E|nr:chitinase CLP-like [Triticum dicoccoides]